jgi:hypothetical protein
MYTCTLQYRHCRRGAGAWTLDVYFLVLLYHLFKLTRIVLMLLEIRLIFRLDPEILATTQQGCDIQISSTSFDKRSP